MQSIIRILVVGPVEDREWDGRKYTAQQAECILLNDDGSTACVGVLRLPEDMKGDKAPKPGDYTATFAMRPNRKNRAIEAYVVKFTPLPPNHFARKAA